MKNVKIVGKLRIGFAVLLLLASAVVLFGAYGMYQMEQSNRVLYNHQLKAIELLSDIRTKVHMQRVLMRNLVLYKANTEPYMVSAKEMETLDREMDESIASYNELFAPDERPIEFAQFEEAYTKGFKDSKVAVAQFASQDDKDRAFMELLKTTLTVDRMTEAIAICYDDATKETALAVENSASLFYRYTLTLFALFALAVVLSVVTVELLNRIIAGPLGRMLDAANKIAGGSMDVDIPDHGRDEVGMLAEAFRRMVGRIANQAQALSRIAEGDLSIEPYVAGQDDIVGNALKGLSDNFNRIARDISSMSVRVASGAQQVNEGSHSLAQGSTEQASAIEELSSSIFEISLSTKENAKMTVSAAALFADMKRQAQESSALMGDLMDAVKQINDASASISKIIKLINDISFQTNILALNAAVEAANAGQHGKGFAVVAGEVRNLAARSSEAAKDTDALIENSLDKARLGASIATRTSEALKQIVTGIMQSAELIDDIARSSSEQSVGIEQINVGIEQVAQVVNLNTVTAEKSAMAAEELAAQASAMEQLVAGFKLRGGAEPTAVETPAVRPAEAPKPQERPVIILDMDEGFGKY